MMENSLSEENDLFIDVETHDSSNLEILNENTSEETVPKNYEIDEEIDGPNFKPPEIDFDSIGEFCFESDELALKGNADYKNLLEAIVVLEAQRAKAVKDLEQLDKLKEEALADPFEFLERMRRGEAMNFPLPQKIHPVPVIDWAKYAISGNPSAFEKRQISQQRQQIQEFYRNSSRKVKQQKLNCEQKLDKNNESWSVEDVESLKKLLIEFPPEENEALRWEKIATALGNHTPFEVANKVCSQYSTLAIDIGEKLGKLPDITAMKKKLVASNSEDGNQDQQQKDKENTNEPKLDISDDDEISSDLQDLPEYQELMSLKRALREKIVEESSGNAQHVGYKCCLCKTEPIVGMRWHCVDCKPPLSTDFCEDCAACSYETRQHTADHKLEKQPVSKGFLDRDYMHFLGSDYNYLDPNYMPAT